jgi:hypothetical protein
MASIHDTKDTFVTMIEEFVREVHKVFLTWPFRNSWGIYSLCLNFFHLTKFRKKNIWQLKNDKEPIELGDL